MPIKRIVAVFGALSLAWPALAQSTNATCYPNFEWSYNSKGQSPCLMSSYLLGACSSDPATAFVSALPSGYLYTGPRNAAQDNPCWCSTVLYSALSMCAICQERDIITWTGWDSNCTSVYVGHWPQSVPSGTDIPSWALEDVVTPDGFNATEAQILASQKPKKKSHTGAIVGGVVGGILGAILIMIILGWFCMKRRRLHQVKPAPPTEYATLDTSPTMPPQSPPMMQTPGPPAPPSVPPPAMPMPYDPDNPQTFPQSYPTPSESPSAFIPGPYGAQTASPYQEQLHYQPTGAYRGAPEV